MIREGACRGQGCGGLGLGQVEARQIGAPRGILVQADASIVSARVSTVQAWKTNRPVSGFTASARRA